MQAPPNYSGVVGAGLGLHSENFREKYPVGLDPQESFAEVNEDRSVEDTVGVEVEVLEAVVLQKPLEEIAGRERQPSLEPREHGDLVRVLLHGVRIVDAKCALSANHTASRKAGFARAERG
jgi:hypothetical protein